MTEGENFENIQDEERNFAIDEIKAEMEYEHNYNDCSYEITDLVDQYGLQMVKNIVESLERKEHEER